jgi:SAM-dependent methyltransferase
LPPSNEDLTNGRRGAHEIEHGKRLSAGDTEQFWGWGTPAGKERAKRRARLISDAAELKPGMNILEIGCGTGMFTEMFASSGARITALDISPDLLDKAQARGIAPDRVTFLNMPFEDYRPDAKLDAVIGSSVLHHLDITIAGSGIYSILNPGGIMCFAEPNMMNPQVFIERRFRRWFPSVSPDETAFVRWKLRKSLQRIGFANVEIKPFDWLHPGIPAGFIALTKTAGGIMEKAPFVKEFAGSLLISAGKPLA